MILSSSTRTDRSLVAGPLRNSNGTKAVVTLKEGQVEDVLLPALDRPESPPVPNEEVPVGKSFFGKLADKVHRGGWLSKTLLTASILPATGGLGIAGSLTAYSAQSMRQDTAHHVVLEDPVPELTPQTTVVVSADPTAPVTFENPDQPQTVDFGQQFQENLKRAAEQAAAQQAQEELAAQRAAEAQRAQEELAAQQAAALRAQQELAADQAKADLLISALPDYIQETASQHWPGIVTEARRQGVNDDAQLAYILATTIHESGAGMYMEELTSGQQYEGWVRSLGNTEQGDGVRFKGRGYVQITGRRNYTDWSERLGLNLVNNPELAEQPEIAAQILVGGMKEGTFTGYSLDDFINEGGRVDFRGARQIVNGMDKAQQFANDASYLYGVLG